MILIISVPTLASTSSRNGEHSKLQSQGTELSGAGRSATTEQRCLARRSTPALSGQPATTVKKSQASGRSPVPEKTSTMRGPPHQPVVASMDWVPELGSVALHEEAREVLCATYQRLPLTVVGGEGAWVVTDDGKRLLDLVAGIAVNILGHGHPALVEAIASQAATLIHASNLYYTEPQVRLAQKLVASAFPSRVFFCNSGAEANEAAIKVARKWGRMHRDGAHVVVTLRGAFHGRTLGALAATAVPRYCEPFQPLPAGFRQVERHDPQALEAAVGADVAAVLVEPIQGESGVVPIPDQELALIREICDRRDVLLIVDEVQCGLGRTGRMWAHQWAGIVPDIMTVAKGLAGGVPIGAALIGPRADVLQPGDHGSTFGGNPLACAAGLAVLQTVEREGLAERAGAMGERLREGILRLRDRGLPIMEVRGRGLMLAVVLRRPVAAEVARRAPEFGLLVNAVGPRTLRLVPPLILEAAESDLAVRLLGDVIGAAAEQAA